MNSIISPQTTDCKNSLYVHSNKIWYKKILISDFSVGSTGGWGGGVSNTMIMIGNFRVIKGLI